MTTKNLTLPRKTEESANGKATTGELITQANELVEKVKGSITELRTTREQLVSALGTTDEQIAELREMLGEPAEEDRPARKQVVRSGRGGGRTPGVHVRRNVKKLEAFVFDAIKKGGKTGVSQEAVAKMVLEAGFETPSTGEQFEKSCYVSGINKLTTRGWAERINVAGERKGRYRLTAKAPKVWSEE